MFLVFCVMLIMCDGSMFCYVFYCVCFCLVVWLLWGLGLICIWLDISMVGWRLLVRWWIFWCIVLFLVMLVMISWFWFV